MNEQVEVYLSAGSNIDPLRNIRMACRELAARFGTLRLSSLYRSAPAGFSGDDFLNMVIGLTTRLGPAELLDELERLHDLAGRRRGSAAFASRTLDLDLLLYGRQVIDRPPVRVPREDIERYSFVLAPLAEIAPDLLHPVSGRRIAEMWRDFDRSAHPVQRLTVSPTG